MPSALIEANKENYYLALRRTQQTIRKQEQNWEYWLAFFLKTMARQKDKLAAKVKEEQALRSSLPALSRQILELVKTRGEITVREIEEATSANRNTIKGAREEARRGELSGAGRERPGRTLHAEIETLALRPQQIPRNKQHVSRPFP